jgi:hypothetical protein
MAFPNTDTNIGNFYLKSVYDIRAVEMLKEELSS